MAHSSTNAAAPRTRVTQISAETAAEAPVAIERPDSAVGKAKGKWHKTHLLPAFICVLLGLAMFMAKSGRVSSLLRRRPVTEGESTNNHSRNPDSYIANHRLWPREGRSTPEAERTYYPRFIPLDPRFRSPAVPGEADSRDVFEHWDLPGVGDMEEALYHANKHGKRFLAELVEQNDKTVPVASSEGQAVLRSLARSVSGGVTDQLIGLTVDLTNMVPFAGDDTGIRTSRRFQVTRYLGEGSFKVVVEVFDVESTDFLALSVFFNDYDSEQDRDVDIGTVASQMNEAVAYETRVAMKACGPTPPALASHKRGIALPLFLAEVAGMPDVLLSENVYVLRKVQLMERLHGDMKALTSHLEIVPQGTKEYIAERLLLEVLHLQEAHVSHNDIKWSNLLLRADGSFLLSDFGSSCVLGERMGPSSGITPAYTEPDLLSEFTRSMFYGLPAFPEDKSDMWSLGVLLFELFTDGQTAYGNQGSGYSLRQLSMHANMLVVGDASPLRLIPQMRNAKVPQRWQELIIRLLQPGRPKRISAREVARDFSDLFGGGGR